ncbi:MAG: DHH family phosphoesterase [Gemmataceae bacterium]
MTTSEKPKLDPGAAEWDSRDRSSGRRAAAPARRFLSGLQPYRRAVLVSHVNPDPDSLGSMLALSYLIEQRLGLPTRLTREGFIGRAENQMMVQTLEIELYPLEQISWSEHDALIMVDSQPHTGRHTLPADLPLYAVIDHHERTEEGPWTAEFVDIRTQLGATCTLVASYLAEEQVPFAPRIATALFYGIESELNVYPREASPLDDAALLLLYPHADKDILARIRNARLPQSYFATLVQALQNSFIYDRLIMSWAGELPQPELTAEIADFLLRFEEIDWSFCAGTYRGQMLLSVRTTDPRGGAAQVIQKVVNGLGRAGGHPRRAGGAIPLTSSAPSYIEQIQSQLRRRFLQALKIDEQRGQRLISKRELLQGLQG